MKRWICGLVLALASGAVLAANAGNGEKLFKDKNCFTCHGDRGNEQKVPGVAIVHGQHADFVIAALKAYRLQARVDAGAKLLPGQLVRKNALMNGAVASLSDVEIKDIAAFLARQSGGVAFKK